jgi:ribosomal-protein-serine acetyltransferase
MMRFPFQQLLTLSGKDIDLCTLQRADARALYRLVEANRRDLLLSFPVLSGEVVSALRARAWISERRRQQEQGQGITFGVFRKDEPALIGYLAAVHIDHRVPKCELAYFMDANWRRKGLMRQGVAMLLEYLFYGLGFNKTLCRVAPENEASLRMLETLGFEREGYVRNDFRGGDGEIGDCIYLGKVPEGTFRT